MLTYCTRIIAIRPKFASPQVLFDCGLSPEYLTPSDTLEYLSNPACRNLGMRPTQYVDMIIIHAHPLYFYFVSFLDFYGGLSDYFHHIPIQQGFTIFHRKYDVIVNRPRTVASLVSLRSLFHVPSLTHKVTPQQAAGNCKLNSLIVI